MLLEKKEDINIILIIFESFFRDILLIRLKKEELTKKCIEILFDIIFNPLIENNGFK